MIPSQCLMDWGVVTPFAVFQHVFLPHSSLSTFVGAEGEAGNGRGKKKPNLQCKVKILL